MTEPAQQRQDDVNPKFLLKPKLSSLGKLANRVAKLINVNFTPEADELLRIVDEYDEGKIILIHYLSPKPEVAHVRGIIVDLETETVSCPTYPFEPEMDVNEFLAREDQQRIRTEISETTLAKEGTLIRTWFSERLNQWFFSTFKRIEGQHSRWSGKPFGERFFEIADEPSFWATISKIKTPLAFLLSHPENRIVCDIHPEITLVGVFNGSKFELPRDNLGLSPISVSSSFDVDWNTLSSYLDTNEYAGLTLHYRENNRVLRLVSPNYVKKRELRGNEPFLSDRWVVLYKEDRHKELEEAYNDEFSQTIFERARQSIQTTIPEKFLSFYRRRYIHTGPNFYWLPPQEHYIIKTVREKLLTLKKENDMEAVLAEIKKSLSESNSRQLNCFRYRIRNDIY